ncbi:T-cell immunoglobulin and mucin domain-containing protein 2-like isoform X2 [Mugil cephalus]|uniref:T-cell immunoglobulin and mucin domain-containing protein 2-like isoform X2 n=1 Tax=Mugil cephalus TaxID=48193 RepID=UPI001FB6F07D|nr:T-cell immunoglobulin and mucin domain-containing protein 2-like isoform X2 [Mugil cephalus]
MLLLLIFSSVCVPSESVAMETVVGVAGQAVRLPCGCEAVEQGQVEVCWGRGEPSLFTCHNILIDSSRDKVTYRKSLRVQLPGLFNDQTSSVLLIISNPYSVSSSKTSIGDVTEQKGGDVIELRGTDVTEPRDTNATESGGNDVTEPVLAQVQSSIQQHRDTLQMFIGHTLRLSFIIFIPALMTAVYKVWRSRQKAETDRRTDQTDEEDWTQL